MGGEAPETIMVLFTDMQNTHNEQVRLPWSSSGFSKAPPSTKTYQPAGGGPGPKAARQTKGAVAGQFFELIG